jgi:transglutaminase/protease-like cytokinesis protein 3
MIKKHLSFVFISILFATTVLAQNSEKDYARVDSIARTYEKSDYKLPEDLAVALCKNLNTPREKARAIFTFLATNIKYNPNDMDRDPVRASNKEEIEEKKNEVAKKCYKKGKGICEDYSRLYKMMCDAVDVECIMVTGIAFSGRSHAWNAIKLDNKWELVEVTWGSGYLDDDERFHFRFSSGFFCVNPTLFILDHFPKDPQWQLLGKSISRVEYGQQMRKVFYGVYDIKDCSPMNKPLIINELGKYEVFFYLGKKMDYITVKQYGKAIPFTQENKEDKTVLRFKAASNQKVEVFMGESEEQYRLIGIYKTAENKN